MKRILSHQPLNKDLGILLLRLMFGALFIYYGYMKIASYDQYVTQFPDPIGLGTKLSFNLVIFAEFFCGIFVFLGIFTRLTVLPILFTMIVVYFITLAAQPFQDKQIALVFLVLSVVIFILGGGKFSLDKLIFGRNRQSV